MVKICNNVDDIVCLWNEAFGDSREDIVFFVDNVKNGKCLMIYDDNSPKSMLYLVDCELNGKKSNYVYAACTLKSARKCGYMSELLEYCKTNYASVSLIPANKGLIDYYKTRGLTNEYNVSSLSFEQIDGINEYLFEGCELEKPIVLEYKGE